jgi:hypothetical protein
MFTSDFGDKLVGYAALFASGIVLALLYNTI